MRENKSKGKSVKASAKKRTLTLSITGEAGHEAALAADLANVLSNPFTPVELYNTIADLLGTLTAAVPPKEACDTAEHIERVLNWHRGLGYRNYGLFEKVRLGDGYHATRLKNPSVCRLPSKHQQGGAANDK